MHFSRSGDIHPIELEKTKIGGVHIEGRAELKVIMEGDNMQIVELNLDKDYYHPSHCHPENESLGYVISGAIQMKVGNEEKILFPGDAWHHPKGVYHSTKALEVSKAVEIHTPKRPEYKTR